MERLKDLFPMLSWLLDYDRAWLKDDFYAGVTIGVILVPQGMAYALIAGLSPIHGLYAALIPPLLYTVFGTSRQLSVGPVAMDSLLIASGVSVLATEGTDAYLHFVVLLTFFVGFFQVTLGTLKLGFITNLLSRSVISGFTSGAAVIILLNQVKYIFDIDLPKSNQLHTLLADIPLHIKELNWISLGFGLTTIAILIAVKKFKFSVPGSLIVVMIGTIVAFWGNVSDLGISVIKEIPSGLPSFAIPQFDSVLIVQITPLALTLAVVSFIESYSIARGLEIKRGQSYTVSNKELLALGLSNIGGAFFGAFSIAGGFSRSAVNADSGAKTPLAMLVSSFIVGLVLLYLTSVFYHLPLAVLGGVIIVSVYGLIDLSYAKELFSNSKKDFLLLLTTFLSTVFFSLTIGILTGVIASIIHLLYNLANPHIARLGRLEGHHEFRNIDRFPNVKTWNQLLILRIDAPLTFINISFVKDYILKALLTHGGSSVKSIIIDAGPISHIDASAASGLSELLDYLELKNIDLLMCDLIGPVRDSLKRSGLFNKMTKDRIFLDLNEAVKYATTKEQGAFKTYALQSNEDK